ncbi:MAG: hypothetical protein LBK50_01420 [Candidatus Nomurabacteria bacterium]|jgi:hypothetical protein|nr:hypothetical protein [Candidatus Nomurabacteria bacterium]
MDNRNVIQLGTRKRDREIANFIQAAREEYEMKHRPNFVEDVAARLAGRFDGLDRPDYLTQKIGLEKYSSYDFIEFLLSEYCSHTKYVAGE